METEQIQVNVQIDPEIIEFLRPHAVNDGRSATMASVVRYAVYELAKRIRAEGELPESAPTRRQLDVRI